MGFVPPFKVFVLDFTDTVYAGAEIKVRSVPLDTFLGITKAGALSANSGQLTVETANATTAMIERLGGSLVSWNLQNDDGTPIPANIDGLKTLDMSFVLAMVHAWMEAIGDIPGPLGESSSPMTLKPDLLSLPMEPLQPINHSIS